MPLNESTFIFVCSIVYKNDNCQAKQGAQAAMDLILNDKVHAIIGSVCSQGKNTYHAISKYPHNAEITQ